MNDKMARWSYLFLDCIDHFQKKISVQRCNNKNWNLKVKMYGFFFLNQLVYSYKQIISKKSKLDLKGILMTTKPPIDYAVCVRQLKLLT